MPSKVRLHQKRKRPLVATVGASSARARHGTTAEEGAYQNSATIDNYNRRHPTVCAGVLKTPTVRHSISKGSPVQNVSIFCTMKQAIDIMDTLSSLGSKNDFGSSSKSIATENRTVATNPAQTMHRLHPSSAQKKGDCSCPSTQMVVYRVCANCGRSYSVPNVLSRTV